MWCEKNRTDRFDDVEEFLVNLVRDSQAAEVVDVVASVVGEDVGRLEGGVDDFRSCVVILGEENKKPK